jgi:hypothetical protein
MGICGGVGRAPPLHGERHSGFVAATSASSPTSSSGSIRRRRAGAGAVVETAGAPLMDGMRAMSLADTTTMMGPATTAHGRRDENRAVPRRARRGDRRDRRRRRRGVGHGAPALERAMARPAEDAGPIGHRDLPFLVVVSSQAEDREQCAGAKAAVDGVAARPGPHATGGSFLNLLGDPARTPTAYTPEDHGRLAAIKRADDPDNVFHPVTTSHRPKAARSSRGAARRRGSSCPRGTRAGSPRHPSAPSSAGRRARSGRRRRRSARP